MNSNSKNNLIDGKYKISDLINVSQLTTIFTKFSKATGFTIGLIDNNSLEIIIKTGWHDICENFHRADEKACQICKNSNKKLFSNLNKEKAVKIIECEHGLYDCATPMIIEGKHIANITTGQLLMKEPEIKRYKKQAKEFGFNETEYLAALQKVPIVSKQKVTDMMDYLSEFSIYIAKSGLRTLRANKPKNKYKKTIEQLKIAKENTEENEKKIKDIFNNTLTAIYTFNNEKEFIDTNQAGIQLLGYSKEELLTKRISDVDANTEAVLPAHETLLEGGILEGFEHQLLRKDNKTITVLNNSIPIQNKKGNIVGMQSFLMDITDRKESERLIQEQEKRISSIFRSAPIGIGVANNRILTYVNKKLCKISGYSATELIGKSAQILYPSKEDYEYVGKEKYEQIKKHGTGTVETRFKQKSGKIIDILLSSSPIDLDDPNKGITFTALDITKCIETEQKLIRQNEEYLTLNDEYETANKELISAKINAEESNRLKTEFLNNMSHEIRTPMNGILGFSEELKSPNLSEEKRTHYINIIKNSGNQLMRIIDDILEISNLETKQLKLVESPVCMNNLLLDQFSDFDLKAKENKTPLYLSKELSDKESTILTDETKLKKVLSNLLENAIKYTTEGYVEFGYTLITTNDETPLLEIYVKDTGIGIRPERQKMIFERFSQEEKEITHKTGGLGLGLSIAKENVKLLNGNITLISKKGKGSTFYVTIPYKPVLSDYNASKKNDIKKELKNQHTILIAEDEEINHLYLETLLRKTNLNLKTLHAKNGKEAVELCRENPEIEFVFMDLKMPVMTGFKATELIKEFRPDLPIVAQTSYSTSTEHELAISAGCDDFISKPMNKEVFFNIIRKYISDYND